MAVVLQCLVLAGVVTWSALGNPVPNNGNFIGEGTNELATALLQGFVGQEDNQVYSPLGYSAVLAIFAEGARGESRKEIAAALHFPSDIDAVRNSYKTVLQRLMVKNYTGANNPELKNWFYIYKNYSVEEDLKGILREYYLTEVKTVERPECLYGNETKILIPEAKPNNEEKKIEKHEDKKEAEQEAKPIEDKKETEKEDQIEMEKEEKKDSVPESSEKKVLIPEPKPEIEEIVEIEAKPDADKTVIAVVESAQKVHKVDSEEAASNNEEVLLGDKPKEDKLEELPGVSNIRDKNHLVKDGEEVLETATVKVLVVEEHQEHEAMVAEQRSMDGSSGMTKMDHFSGMTDSSLKIKGREPQSQMIIFNGLFYRGDWKVPFVKQPAQESKPFYMSETEKVTVPTIHSEGTFLAGEVTGLDTRAIELPYKGDRYSLMVLVPNSRNGLAKLISDLDGVSLNAVRASLTEKAVEICLPIFEITTISKPISSLSKLGMSRVTSIFDPNKADLSGISKQDPGLYVEELVQMVTFKVDGDNSETNFLTASQASSRTDFEKFAINHPFLFFLRDNIDDIIVVTGKVINPTPKPDFFEGWQKEEDKDD